MRDIETRDEPRNIAIGMNDDVSRFAVVRVIVKRYGKYRRRDETKRNEKKKGNDGAGRCERERAKARREKYAFVSNSRRRSARVACSSEEICHWNFKWAEYIGGKSIENIGGGSP